MRETVNLNRKWAFIMGSEDVPKAMPSPACYVNLPHTWNAIDGQDGGNDYYRGVCTYEKHISKDSLPKGDEVYIEICGANSSATVYFNEKKLI